MANQLSDEEEVELKETENVLSFIPDDEEEPVAHYKRSKSPKTVSFRKKIDERDDKPRKPTPVNLKKSPKKGALVNSKGNAGTNTDPPSPDSPDSSSDPTATNLELHALSGLLKPVPKPKPIIQIQNVEPQEGEEEDRKKEPRRPQFGKGPFDACPPGCIPTSIKRQILYGGDPRAASPPYPPGTRLTLHFRTMGTDDEKVYDDSRTYANPLEMIIGKKFKLEVWEVLVNALRKGEVSLFIVPMNHCMMYPMLAKILRGALKAPNAVKQHEGHGCCMGAMMNGTGYPDLDELIRTPKGLTFVFELVQVELPGEYEMESWYMTDVEKIESIPVLHADGNKFFNKKEYPEAGKRYSEAVQRLDELIAKEVPKSPEARALEKQKLPLLLNVTACLIKTNDFYDALRTLETVFKIDKDSVKGFFRRAQCNKALRNYREARADFEIVQLYDPTLHKVVRENLAEIDALEGNSNEQDKLTYMKAFKALYHPKEVTPRVINRRALRAALNSTYSDYAPLHSPICRDTATSNPCDTVTVEKVSSETEVHNVENTATIEVPASSEITGNANSAAEPVPGCSKTITDGKNATIKVPASSEITGNDNSAAVPVPGCSKTITDGKKKVPASPEVTRNYNSVSEQVPCSSETTTDGNNANPEEPDPNEATGNGNSVIVEIPGPSGTPFDDNA